LNQALKLRSAKRYDKAKEILLALADENENSASVFALLGDVYWRLNSLDNAVQSFTRATKLSPESELASLGLFHTLWESGCKGLALNEMQRFLSLSRSAEYAKLIRELIPLPTTGGKSQADVRKGRKENKRSRTTNHR
jgi:predicted Zn-dependent protease